MENISKEFEEQFEKHVNRLYDDFVFEEISSLRKERESLMNFEKDSSIDEDDFDAEYYENQVRLKEIDGDLKDIYESHKEEIDFLIGEEPRKLLDKKSYENLVWLSDLYQNTLVNHI